MTKPGIMPVHIIYDDIAIVEEKHFHEQLRQLAVKLETTPAGALVLLSLICVGRVLKLSYPKEFRNSIVDKELRVDLRAALERVAADYSDLEKAGVGVVNPEVLLFLGTQPASDWNIGTKALRDRSFSVSIRAWWISQQPLSESTKNSLKQLLTQISHASAIVEPPDSKNRGYLDKVLLQLQQRIEKSRDLEQPVKRIQSRSASAPPPGFGAVAPKPLSAALTPKQVTPAPSSAVTPSSVGGDRVPLFPAKSPETTLSMEDTQEKVDRPTAATSVPADAEQASSQSAQSAGQDQGASELHIDERQLEASTPSETTPAALPPPKLQPAKWDVKEPPAELQDRTYHTYTDSRPETRGWYVVGASRRGKLHEHEGTFREDAFKIENAAGWHLIAVADGAGSHHLSRVGSNLAVETAVSTMVETVKSNSPGKPTARMALQDALNSAWKALWDEAEKRKVDFKDLSTTLLLLAYHPIKNVVGVAQIGDGLLAAQLEDGKIALLGKPESGEYSGQTLFLTNHKYEELAAKVETPEPPGPIKLFFIMTDGVADDLYPPQERLPGLVKPMPEVIAAANPEQALLDLIGYPRPGSFDDRTLVVLCQPQKLNPANHVSEQVETKSAGGGTAPQAASAQPENEVTVSVPGESKPAGIVEPDQAVPAKDTELSPTQPVVSDQQNGNATDQHSTSESSSQ
jgi:hypothetical protein